MYIGSCCKFLYSLPFQPNSISMIDFQSFIIGALTAILGAVVLRFVWNDMRRRLCGRTASDDKPQASGFPVMSGASRRADHRLPELTQDEVPYAKAVLGSWLNILKRTANEMLSGEKYICKSDWEAARGRINNAVSALEKINLPVSSAGICVDLPTKMQSLLMRNIINASADVSVGEIVRNMVTKCQTLDGDKWITDFIMWTLQTPYRAIQETPEFKSSTAKHVKFHQYYLLQYTRYLAKKQAHVALNHLALLPRSVVDIMNDMAKSAQALNAKYSEGWSNLDAPSSTDVAQNQERLAALDTELDTLFKETRAKLEKLTADDNKQIIDSWIVDAPGVVAVLNSFLETFPRAIVCNHMAVYYGF